MAEDTTTSSEEKTSAAGWKITVAACAFLLLLAGGITFWIYSSEPTAQRETATRETAMLVETTTVQRGDYRPEIVVMGTVEPEQDVMLSSRVGGEIIEISPSFQPGGFVEKGEVLLRIDPADYRNIVEQRRSDLSQAQAELSVEQGRQNVARQDYELLDQTLAEENRELVLRKPQLGAAQARVDAARAAVEQAQLDLERTEVRAPFDAQVIERNVNVGSQVAQGDDLAHLVGIDTYWVVATVPLNKLRWIEVPSSPDEPGAEVRIRNRSAWPEDLFRMGHVDRLIGALDAETRLARVLVTVEDPLARANSIGSDSPPMIIGAVVETRIRGRELPGVIRVNRDFVREGDTIWVKEDGKLRIAKAGILMRDAQYAYVNEGLDDGAEIVTSSLATVAEGAPLRRADEQPEPEQPTAADPSQPPTGEGSS